MVRVSLVVLAFLASALADNNNNDNKNPHDLVAWLRSKEHGYFSDKLKLHINPESSTANGMFAVDHIKKNEAIMAIPKECLLRPSENTENDMDMCETTKSLAKEYLLGDQAKFQAYAQYTLGYLRNNNDNTNKPKPDRFKLPRAWSPRAQNLLKDIVGEETVEPQHFEEGLFMDRCGPPYVRDFVRENPTLVADYEEAAFLLSEAWLQVVSRSWNELMVPLLDMIDHRNGHWHNVDQLTSAHDPDVDVVTVVAKRDILPGEELYFSYNMCRDVDCEGLDRWYVLPQILNDYGFVEQYPRRWRFDFNQDDEDEEKEDEENIFIFEIDHQVIPSAEDPEPPLKLTWLSPFYPTPEDIHRFQGILNRLYGLKDHVMETAEHLPANSEKVVILDYYQALTEALEFLIRSTDINPKFQTLEENTSNDLTTYDDLEERKRNYDEESLGVCDSDSSPYLGNAPYDEVDETESQYQKISFEHNSEIDDTCLYLSGWLQTCTSWRPHYHETVVHYPLKFVDEPKRVIYLGGGDNMLLHEILKYPSLELVIGMELDHQVVRSSFRNMATQPHFDNDKVQWWFGDATKTLAMLLEQGDKFYHTFDLVIVDLQTNVAETLMVTKDMTIMDVAVELLQPDGIIARNEDFYPRRSVGFVKYEVDLEVLDVPMLCQQSITIGSKNVDFLKKTPKDHNINTVYLGKSDLDKGSDKYVRWLNYRNNDLACNQTTKKGNLDGNVAEDSKGGHGVHMILEVEDTYATVESSDTISKRISAALTDAGLTELSIDAAPSSKEMIIVFLCIEGYVIVQAREQKRYIGFDIKLWSDYEKLETVKAKLIAAVGSKDEKASSSYRIVTGGMFGALTSKEACTIPMEALATCDELGESVQAEQVETVADDTSMAVIRKAISKLAVVDPTVAVLCADPESSCSALYAVTGATATKNIIPMRACSNLANADEMLVCETSTLASLLASGTDKIDVIVIDSQTPKEMGQILHKILTLKPRRVQLLQKDYVVLSTSHDAASASWQRALLERFQTEFDPFSPAQRSRVSFRGNNGAFDVGIFSSGDYKFFTHLEEFIAEVEKETGLAGQIRKVDDGRLNYIPGFRPSIIGSGDDYEHHDALTQFLNQVPIGEQTILQFEIQPQYVSLDVEETVLVNIEKDVWKGEWFMGKVLQEKEDGKYAVYLDHGVEEVVDRDSMRIFETDSPIDVPDAVLIRRNGYWSQGAIIAKNAHDETFNVRRFDSDGDVITVHRSDLVRRFEPVDIHGAPALTCTKVKRGFVEAIRSSSAYMDKGENAKDDVQVSSGFGEGCVIVGLAPEVTAVASWDGRSHIDVSLFVPTNDQVLQDTFADAFLAELDFLSITARDEFPRGYGRVVNFASDLNYDEELPHWIDA